VNDISARMDQKMQLMLQPGSSNDDQQDLHDSIISFEYDDDFVSDIEEEDEEP